MTTRYHHLWQLTYSDSFSQRSILSSMPVAYSDIHPTLYVVHKRAKPVLQGPNSTDPNLFHHGETTYRVGWMSEYATGMLLRIDLWRWWWWYVSPSYHNWWRSSGRKGGKAAGSPPFQGLNLGGEKYKIQKHERLIWSLCLIFDFNETISDVATCHPHTLLVVKLFSRDFCLSEMVYSTHITAIIRGLA